MRSPRFFLVASSVAVGPLWGGPSPFLLLHYRRCATARPSGGLFSSLGRPSRTARSRPNPGADVLALGVI